MSTNSQIGNLQNESKFQDWYDTINTIINVVNDHTSNIETFLEDKKTEKKYGQILSPLESYASILSKDTNEETASYKNITDLNLLTTNGVYYTPSGIANLPVINDNKGNLRTDINFVVYVAIFDNESYIDETSYFISQIAIDNTSDPHVYSRNCAYDVNNKNYTWSSWKEYTTETEISEGYIRKESSTTQTIHSSIDITGNLSATITDTSITGNDVIVNNVLYVGGTGKLRIDKGIKFSNANASSYTYNSNYYSISSSEIENTWRSSVMSKSGSNYATIFDYFKQHYNQNNERIKYGIVHTPIRISMDDGFTEIYGTIDYADYLNRCGIWDGFVNDSSLSIRTYFWNYETQNDTITNYIEERSKDLQHTDLTYTYNNKEYPYDSTIKQVAFSCSGMKNYHKYIKDTYFKISGGRINGKVYLYNDLWLDNNNDGFSYLKTLDILGISTGDGVRVLSRNNYNLFFLDRPNESTSKDENDQYCLYGSRTTTINSDLTNGNGNIVYTLGGLEIHTDKLLFRIRKKNSAGNNDKSTLPSRFLAYERIVDDDNNETNLVLRPDSCYGTGKTNLGSAGFRFEDLFLKSSSIISYADETGINEISETETSNFNKLLDNWGSLSWYGYRYTSDETGSDTTRIHIGTTAQEIDKVFKAANLENQSDYGFYCYDSWDNIYDTEAVETYLRVYDSVEGKFYRNVDDEKIYYTSTLFFETDENGDPVKNSDGNYISVDSTITKILEDDTGIYYINSNNNKIYYVNEQFYYIENGQILYDSPYVIVDENNNEIYGVDSNGIEIVGFKTTTNTTVYKDAAEKSYVLNDYDGSFIYLNEDNPTEKVSIENNDILYYLSTEKARIPILGKDQSGEFIYPKTATIKSKRLVKSAGSEYSIRYQELQAVENAYLRNKINDISTTTSDLKTYVTAIKNYDLSSITNPVNNTYTVKTTDDKKKFLIDSPNFVLNLSTLSENFSLFVKNTCASSTDIITLSCTEDITIDGLTTFILYQNEYVEFIQKNDIFYIVNTNHIVESSSLDNTSSSSSSSDSYSGSITSLTTHYYDLIIKTIEEEKYTLTVLDNKCRYGFQRFDGGLVIYLGDIVSINSNIDKFNIFIKNTCSKSTDKIYIRMTDNVKLDGSSEDYVLNQYEFVEIIEDANKKAYIVNSSKYSSTTESTDSSEISYVDTLVQSTTDENTYILAHDDNNKKCVCKKSNSVFQIGKIIDDAGTLVQYFRFFLKNRCDKDDDIITIQCTDSVSLDGYKTFTLYKNEYAEFIVSNGVEGIIINTNHVFED